MADAHSLKSTPQAAFKYAYRMDEIAPSWGISRSRAYELIHDGVLKSVRVGGRRLVLHDDLAALFASARGEAT